MESRNSERPALMIAVLGGLVWASFAPTSLLFGVYLRSLGVSYTSIGLLMTVASVLSSSLQVTFGTIADRYGNRKTLISASLLLRTLASFMLMLSGDVINISIWYVGTSLFLSGFMPLAQSIVADLSEGRRLGISMGRYRLFGSMGWAISCIVTGLLAKYDTRNIFPITFAFSIASFLASLALPEVKSTREWHPESTREGARVSATLVICFQV
ncbi:MAG: MFS transporter [Candidatus Bathyarchaeia archaeon]